MSLRIRGFYLLKFAVSVTACCIGCRWWGRKVAHGGTHFPEEPVFQTQAKWGSIVPYRISRVDELEAIIDDWLGFEGTGPRVKVPFRL